MKRTTIDYVKEISQKGRTYIRKMDLTDGRDPSVVPVEKLIQAAADVCAILDGLQIPYTTKRQGTVMITVETVDIHYINQLNDSIEKFRSGYYHLLNVWMLQSDGESLDNDSYPFDRSFLDLEGPINDWLDKARMD